MNDWSANFTLILFFYFDIPIFIGSSVSGQSYLHGLTTNNAKIEKNGGPTNEEIIADIRNYTRLGRSVGL